MKHLSLSLTFLMVLFISLSSFTAQVKEPTASFEKTSHDFGTIKKGEKAEYEFKLTNSGLEPLIISDVIKTCGCTVPTWPKKPVLAGETVSITVTYDSRRVGPFSKSVIVKSNDPLNPEIRLQVKGTVEEDPSDDNKDLPKKK